MRRYPAWMLIGYLGLALAGGCGESGDSSAPVATATPSDPQASTTARAVQAYLADLTNEVKTGVLSGQNTGHGNQILNTSGTVGYAVLIDPLTAQSGETPAIVGIDYEYDRIFTPDQLTEANSKLISHWQAGGLITINWSPNNPWWNDESDLVNNPGYGDLTRTYGGDMSAVKLTSLIDSSQSISTVWQRKLERIADALSELQDAGVVVLWRPMQEMNGNWFWWGISTSPQSCDGYIAVWRDMYTYFTRTRGLHNLLWVFSPNRGPLSSNESGGIKPVDWCYPGDNYVDVVAGTRYDDSLSIDDYSRYRQFGKPIGMGEYGPTLSGTASLAGTYDERNYATVLARYPAIAYWVSWHDWHNADGTHEHQAIVSNQYSSELMQDSRILTLRQVDASTHTP